MVLVIDEDEKTIYIRDFELESGELIELAMKFSEYTFKSDEDTRIHLGPPMLSYDPYEEEEELLDDELRKLNNSSMEYSSKVYCNCPNTDDCQRLIKCKLHIN